MDSSLTSSGMPRWHVYVLIIIWQIKQIKYLELIQCVKLLFSSCLLAVWGPKVRRCKWKRICRIVSWLSKLNFHNIKPSWEHQSLKQRLYSKVQTLVTLKSKKTRLDFARKQLKDFDRKMFGLMKPSWTCTRMIGRKKWIKKEHEESEGSRIMAWICMAVNCTGLLSCMHTGTMIVGSGCLGEPLAGHMSIRGILPCRW